MPSLRRLITDTNERRLAQVTLPYEEARNQMRLDRNTVPDFHAFEALIGNTVDTVHTSCVSHGGNLPWDDAVGRAKEYLEHHHRRHGGTIVSAYNDAHDGTNGGAMGVVNIIVDSMKNEAIERYIRAVFDREIGPHSWPDKVEIMRQFLAECGPHLSSSVDLDDPERYAHDYQEIIQSYVAALQRSASTLRRL
jgi:hypothetical protein